MTVELTWGDTAMQYSQFYGLYEKFVARGIRIMTAVEGVGLTALKDRFAQDQVVVLGAIIGFQDLIYSPGWIYFQAPTLAEQFAVVAKYFKENWKESRAPRFAFVGMDITWGYEPRAEGTKYAQSLGFEVLPTEFVPLIVLDATPQLLRLKEEGADFVYIQALAAAIVPILRDAERLGLLDKIQFSGLGSAMGEKSIQIAGAGSEGFLMSMITPWFDETEVPGIKLMIDKQMEYHGKVERESGYTNGWVEAVVICEAIRRAIENVGYGNLDSAAIKEALDNMKDFDVYGLASITYKDRPLDHRGSTKLAAYQVTGGKIVRVSDWREAPSLVPEGLVRE